MWVRLSRTPEPGTRVEITLPMPPDYRFSFSGSALPFPTETDAFDPAQPSIDVYPSPSDGSVVVLPSDTPHPNHYYRDGTFGPPRARVKYTAIGGYTVDEFAQISGVRRVPGRSLTPGPRLLASTRNLPVTSQETILRSNAMPWVTCLPRSGVGAAAGNRRQPA